MEECVIVMVDKNNFEVVMCESELKIIVMVKNKLIDDENVEFFVEFNFKFLVDFVFDVVVL